MERWRGEEEENMGGRKRGLKWREREEEENSGGRWEDMREGLEKMEEEQIGGKVERMMRGRGRRMGGGGETGYMLSLWKPSHKPPFC